jgi:hypothetical protein
MDMPMPNIIAVVAVFDIQAERGRDRAEGQQHARRPPPIHGSVSTAKATRRSSPWRKMARAMMNDPMKRKISGSAYGANTSFAGATRSDDARRRAQERRGGHRQRLGDPEDDDGRHHRGQPVRLGLEPVERRRQQRAKASGAAITPTRARSRSKRASAAVSTSRPHHLAGRYECTRST